MPLSKVPVQIVEMDIDYCTRDYGSAPCTAALTASTERKCFNTFFTCQDTANFNKGVLTLRFAQNQNGLPAEALISPALRSVSTNPSKINLGGVDDRTGPLGKRARINLTFQDFNDSDTYTDKYQGGRRDGSAQFDAIGYDPLSRGTFFGKLRRRYPYYIGRALRVLDGYEGQALSAMRTRHYVISEWTGPDMSGRVQIVAKDILDLADNDKALCPKPSIGKISVSIDAAELSAVTLEPVGVGAEYATSGLASIGSEVVFFTRSGDTIQITSRGFVGSTAASHSSGDLFQQCYHVSGTSIADVAADLLTQFAGIPASFIPTTDWQKEMEWLAGYDLTATIPKPTGVSKLIGELAQLGVFFWWDDVAQEIRMRSNRPAWYDEAGLSLTDAANIVEGSLKLSDLHKQRITQVIFWHGQIDATGNVTNGENYRRAYVATNTGGSTNEHDQDRVLEIFSRWFGDGNDGVAGAVANRLAIRFKETPQQVEFLIDAKDRTDVSLAELAEITTRALQDETGQSLATQMQITSIEEVSSGHALKVMAQSHQFEGRFGFITENVRPDYAGSSQVEKDKGSYLVDSGSPTFADGTGAYQIY